MIVGRGGWYCLFVSADEPLFMDDDVQLRVAGRLF